MNGILGEWNPSLQRKPIHIANWSYGILVVPPMSHEWKKHPRKRTNDNGKGNQFEDGCFLLKIMVILHCHLNFVGGTCQDSCSSPRGSTNTKQSPPPPTIYWMTHPPPPSESCEGIFLQRNCVCFLFFKKRLWTAINAIVFLIFVAGYCSSFRLEEYPQIPHQGGFVNIRKGGNSVEKNAYYSISQRLTQWSSSGLSSYRLLISITHQ